MLRIVTALMLLPGPAGAAGLEDLGFMTGHWRDGAVEEVWLAPENGMMVGVGRDNGRPGRPSFEFLRIALKEDRPVYLASPNGSAPVPFVLLSTAPGEAVFENKANDFPQRIIYRKAGDGLFARIEGEIGGKSEFAEWNYKKVK